MSITFSFILVLFTTVLLKSTLTHPSKRIAGGSRISIDQVPYQAAVLYNGKFCCGGSIIHESFVLTAGHCLEHRLAENISIRVGSVHTDAEGSFYNASNTFVHPLFNKKQNDHDYGIVELRREIKFSVNVQLIELADSNTLVPEGELLTTNGWGMTCSATEDRNELRSVRVPKVDDDKCSRLYPCFTEAMICAGYEDRKVDASNGDSGGPLVYNNMLVGITSFGPSCSDGNLPGVYAKVSLVNSWIMEIVEGDRKNDWRYDDDDVKDKIFDLLK